MNATPEELANFGFEEFTSETKTPADFAEVIEWGDDGATVSIGTATKAAIFRLPVELAAQFAREISEAVGSILQGRLDAAREDFALTMAH